MVLRGCISSIPAEYAALIPAKIPTDRCERGVHNYFYKPLEITVPFNFTYCPCTTSLCNAGDISLGGTAGTGTPPTTITTPSRRGGFTHTGAGTTKNPRNHQGVDGRSSAKTHESHPSFVIATLLAVILAGHHIH